MIFRRAQVGLVAIGDGVVAILDRYRQHKVATPEAGGVLLGRFIQGTSDIIVDDATTPGPDDIGRRHTFRRGRRRTQGLINQAWRASGGTRNYLGEWHSHPEDDPSPSAVDLVNWRYIVEIARYEQESLLFVIVGRRQVRVWEVFRATGKIFQLGNVSTARESAPPIS